MEKELLKWAIGHSDPEVLQAEAAERKLQKFDPELVNFILGKSEAEQLRECVEAAKPQQSDDKELLDRRVAALEVLEMHVQSLDNAIIMEKCNLWPTIISCLDRSVETAKVVVGALWVIGTAAQNNPAVQSALLQHKMADILISLLRCEQDSVVITKAIYCLSAILRQSPEQQEAFAGADGFTVLSGLVERLPEEKNLLQRIQFMLWSLDQEGDGLLACKLPANLLQLIKNAQE